MSYAKRLLEEQEARGWTLVGNRFVCGVCFDDDAIGQFISVHAECAICDYCGETSADSEPIAAPVDTVFEMLADAIRDEWTDPINELPWEDGEYVFTPDSTDDLVFEIPIPIVTDALLDEFLESFAELYWVPRHFFSQRDDDALRSGWSDFARHVTRRARFFFSEVPGKEYGDIPVADVLSRIGSAVTNAELIKEVPEGTEIYRVRVHKPEESPTSAAALGPPPYSKARQNRMSPAGISMMYGAHDRQTAIAETPTSEPDDVRTLAVFATRKPLLVLDLVDIPPIGSYWDAGERVRRRELAFLHEFTEAVSIPIEADGREHVEYVPTQVMTEFFRYEFLAYDGSLAGIRYRSAKAPDGVCVVLFAGHEPEEEYLSEEERRFTQWMELQPDRTVRLD